MDELMDRHDQFYGDTNLPRRVINWVPTRNVDERFGNPVLRRPSDDRRLSMERLAWAKGKGGGKIVALRSIADTPSVSGVKQDVCSSRTVWIWWILGHYKLHTDAVRIGYGVEVTDGAYERRGPRASPRPGPRIHREYTGSSDFVDPRHVC